mgnify:CR=1 FL=1
MTATPPESRRWEPSATFIEDITALAAALDSVITRENALARENRLTDLAALEPEKTRLAVDYDRHVRALKADPARLRRADPASQAALKTAVASLEGKIEDNARFIGAAKEISEGIIAAAARAASEARRPSIGYAKGPAPQRSVAPATIALDQRV